MRAKHRAVGSVFDVDATLRDVFPENASVDEAYTLRTLEPQSGFYHKAQGCLP